MTYDALLELAKKVTVHAKGQTAVNGLDLFYFNGWNNAITLQMVHQQGASIFNQDLTECDYTTPEAKKALGWYFNWAQARVGPSPLRPGGNPFSLAGGGQLGMTMLGYWFLGAELSSLGAAENRWRLVISPQMGTRRVTSCNTCTGVWIPRLSRKKDAAWKFVEWYTVGKGAEQRAIVGAGIPPVKSMSELLPTRTAENRAALATINADLQYFSQWTFSPYIKSDLSEQIWQHYMSQAFAGTLSLDAAAAAITRTINSQLKRNKQVLG
jgi:multiple sugar transport system substrate-binding protein